nr:MAG TPA: hypothetical protein [Bacteriophage sp.]
MLRVQMNRISNEHQKKNFESAYEQGRTEKV